MPRRLFALLLFAVPILAIHSAKAKQFEAARIHIKLLRGLKDYSFLPILKVPSTSLISVSIRLTNNTVLSGASAISLISARISAPADLSAAISVDEESSNLRLDLWANSEYSTHPPAELEVSLRSPLAPSTTARFAVAALHPVVHAIHSHHVLPVGEESTVRLEVSRATGARRLFLYTENEEIIGVETAHIRQGSRLMITFAFPAIRQRSIKPIHWKLEVVQDGVRKVAIDDTKSVSFIAAPRPKLNAMTPTLSRPSQVNYVTLFGVFEDIAAVFFGKRRLKQRDILDLTASEIRVRVSRGVSGGIKKRKTIDVTVVTDTGLRSKAVQFVFDPDALHVTPVVLRSSYQGSSGRALLPILCNRSEVPTVLARVDGKMEEKGKTVYNFSMRTTDMPGSEFRTIAQDKGDMVALDETLFDDRFELENTFLTVLVNVSVGSRIGQASLFLSRRLQMKRIGVTVLPANNGVRRSGTPFVLEAELSSLSQCHLDPDLSVLFSWTVNGRSASSPQVAPLKTAVRGTKPILMGFGNRILLPKEPPWDYALSVTVRKTETGKVFARGFTKGRIVRSSLRRHLLQAILNGGVRTVEVPTSKNFDVESIVLDQNLEEANTSNVRYTWECKDVSRSGAACPMDLFPSNLGVAAARGVSRFTVAASEEFNGRIVQYSLQALLRGARSQVAAITVTFVSSSEKLFPRAELRTGSGLLRSGNRSTGPTFEQYESIILEVKEPLQEATLGFGLYEQRLPSDLLETDPGLLIARPGYWTREDRNNTKFLGFPAGALKSGNYTLCGAVGEIASFKKGSCWVFNIASTQGVTISSLPISSGIANETVFHVTASSTRVSFNQFYFSLGDVDDADADITRTESNLSTGRCLARCSGSNYVSFTISKPGVFYVKVDMYDPSGTRFLGSARSEKNITVRSAPASPTVSRETMNLQDKILRSIECRDEDAFFAAASQVPQDDSVSTSTLTIVVDALKRVSSFPSVSPLRVSYVIDVCTSILLQQELLDLEIIEALQEIVGDCVQQALLSAPIQSVLRTPLASFYGAAEDKIGFIGSRLEEIGTNAVSLQRLLNNTRTAASRDIALALSFRRECGVTDRLHVPRLRKGPTDLRNEEEEGKPFDEYRIGVSCFRGQITNLGPSPANLELCQESAQANINATARNILASTERHDVVEVSSRDVARSSSVYADIFVFANESGRTTLFTPAEAEDECVTARVTVPVDLDLKESQRSVSKAEGEIRCRQAGNITLTKISAGLESEAEKVSAFAVSDFFVTSGGAVSAFVKVRPPARVRMELNTTLFKLCLEESEVEGQGTSAALLASILGVAALFVIVTCVAAYFFSPWFDEYESYSVPASAAPADSMNSTEDFTQSTGGSSHLVSDKGHSANAWEGEYTSISTGTDRGVLTPADFGSSVHEEEPNRSVRSSRPEDSEWVARPRISGLDGAFSVAGGTDVSGPSSIPVPSGNLPSDGASSSSLEYVVLDLYGRAGTPS